MAKLTKFLGSVANGIFGSQGDMRDYQHAARLFTDNFMRLSPKVEFLYHVFLDINPAAIRTPNPFYGFSSPEARIETGMLVKNFNLPGINVQTETKNQYGKKTNIQTAVQYNPVNLTFHDDNNGLIGGLWEQYFKSQYADSQFVDFLQIEPTYNSQTTKTETVDVGVGGQGAGRITAGTKTTTTSTKQTGLKFGFDNYKSVRFFNSIKLYQLSKKRFFEFELINPIIQSWTPPTMNSSSSNPAENQMTVIYEGVRYNTGRISTESVKGFTALIGTAIKAKRTYDNAKELNREGIQNEVTGIVTRSITNAANRTITMSGFDTVDQNLATPANQTVETVYNPRDAQQQINNEQPAQVDGANSTTSNG
jgi:hypothetical protein